jgi:pimeloyl-ACP methyl ester carboxylesterase
MNSFDASGSWEQKNIAVLHDPIGEFNARGGMDLDTYQAYDLHLKTQHPDLGKESWADVQSTIPSPQLVQDPSTGQKLRIQRFNWPTKDTFATDTVTILAMPFSVSLDPDHIQYQHHLIAQQIAAPFIVFENPSYGDSDALSIRQKQALKKGDFGEVASTMLGIVHELGIRNANLMGYSMGAETATAMAAQANQFGIQVKNLFVMESPRVSEQKPLKLGVNFMSDAANLKFTWQHPADPIMREVAKLKPAVPWGTFSYGMAMTKGGLQQDLKTAMITQPNMKLTLASAASSKISPNTANHDVYTILKKTFAERSIRRVIIPGESHAYGDSGSRFAHLGKLLLEL